MEGQGSHRHLGGPVLPDAVSEGPHGPDIGEVMAAHIRRQPLEPGGLEEYTRRLTVRQQHQHLGHEDRQPGIAKMRVVQNTASHKPPGGGVEQEEPLLGALISDDVLNLVHDVGGQGQDQVIVTVVGGDDAVTAKKSLNVLKIDFGPVLVENGETEVTMPWGGRRRGGAGWGGGQGHRRQKIRIRNVHVGCVQSISKTGHHCSN